MSIHEWIVVFLVYFGVAFMLVAAVGLTRMPDLYTRMHGAAKSTTLGITAIMSAAAVYFLTSAAVTRAILVIVFFFLTAPVATHVLARAAYFAKVARWEGTIVDELEGRYDRASHILQSGQEQEGELSEY